MRLWGEEEEGTKEEDWQQTLAQMPIFKKKKGVSNMGSFPAAIGLHTNVCCVLSCDPERVIVLFALSPKVHVQVL